MSQVSNNEHMHNDGHTPHTASDSEASNGMGTLHGALRGESLKHPVLDGSTEYYADDDVDPRYGMDNPELIRHPSTGEETPTPDEEA